MDKVIEALEESREHICYVDICECRERCADVTDDFDKLLNDLRSGKKVVVDGEHLEMLESLLQNIIRKHDATVRRVEASQGIGYVTRNDDVEAAKRYLATYIQHRQKGSDGTG